jgi:hypothetical protein
MRFIAACVATVLFPIAALAAPITVHNTGVDDADALVAAGATSAFWELVAAPEGAPEPLGSNPYAFLHGAYASNTLTSQWVSQGSLGNAGAGGFYVYGLDIDLTGLDHTSAVITGLFSTDNDGFIRLNGGAAVATTGFADFGSMHGFTINSGFVAGLNTIEVGVNNGGNPTAFHVQFLRADSEPETNGSVPEPTTLTLLGAGLTAAGAAARRRRASR